MRVGSTVPVTPSTEHTWAWSAHDVAAAVARGSVSAVDVVRQALDRVAEVDGALNAVCTLDAEGALSAAARADRAAAAGEPLGALHGVPVLVKDMLFTRGLRTTGGSMLYRDLVPDTDDVGVERLRQAGAIVLGKTNTAEFGFSGNQTANQLFGETGNPWDLTRTPGGSSGGSAAAVAAGLAPVALGSDGGGSIRIPAGLCGVVGLKPTFGRLPLHPSSRDAAWPGFSAWESLEHLGPITRDVRDAALALDVLNGYDARDRLSVPTPPADFAAGLAAADTDDLGNLRIAVSADWGGAQPLDSDVRAAFAGAVAALGALGAVPEVAHPVVLGALEAFGTLVDLDFDAAAIAELCAGREDLLAPRLRDLLALDRSVLDYPRAVRLRKQAYTAVQQFFTDVDVLLTPTTPVTAFPLGHNGPETVGGRAPLDRVRAIVGFCCPFNLTGHPAASVPWAVDGRGLPVGVQIVAPRFREDVVLRVARALERRSGLGSAPVTPS